MPLSQNILKRIDLPFELIEAEKEIEGDKRTLLLTKKQGPFVKPCPCSNGSVSCGYYNINVIEGCFFDCSYCILQLYLKNKPITIYVNFDDLFKELDVITEKKQFFRVGPGELADSLCLEPYTEIAKKLILYFNNKNALLEIKTKDHRIDSLLDLEHGNKTVISFSLNPDKIAQSDEKGASSIDERLNAASKAEKHGYFNAFHFDPVIIFDDWEKEYSNLIYKLKETVAPQNVKWISIGLLRFPAQLKNIILENGRSSEK